MRLDSAISSFISVFSNLTDTSIYELPDKEHVILEKETFEIPEQIFSPNSNFTNFKGVCSMILDCVEQVIKHNRRDILGSMIVCGGSTNFYGFNDRLHMEMSKVGFEDVLEAGTKFYYFNSILDRTCTSWLGGSILSSMSSFSDFCASRMDYEEHGFQIFEKRLSLNNRNISDLV